MRIQLIKYNVVSDDGEIYSAPNVSYADFISVYERKTVENQTVLDRIGDAQLSSDSNGVYANVSFVVDSWKARENVKLKTEGVKSRGENGVSFRITGIVAS